MSQQGCWMQVREGRALAPGMDPEAELKTLRLRFDNFRRDFKVQMPRALLLQGH